MNFTALLANPKVKDMLMSAGLSMMANNQARVGQPSQSFGAYLGQGLLGGMEYAQGQEDKRKKEYWQNWDRGVEEQKAADSLAYSNKKLQFEQDKLNNKVDYKTIKHEGRDETWKVDASGNMIEKVGDSPSWQPQQASEGMHQIQDASSPTGWSWKNARGEALPGAPGPSKQKGLAVTLPDGTQISQGGETGSPVSKPTQTKVEQQLLEAQGIKSDLVSQMKQMDPKYLTRPYQMKQAVVGEAGRWGVPMPEGVAKDREAFQSWKSNITNTFNQYVHSVTGAALSPGEAERYMKVVATSEDDPAAFMGKITGFMDAIDRGIQRHQQTLQQGINTSSPIRKLGDSTFKHFKSQGLSDEEAKQRTLDVLSRGGTGG